MNCKEMLWYCDEILHMSDRLLTIGEIVSKVFTRHYLVHKNSLTRVHMQRVIRNILMPGLSGGVA